MHFLLSLRRLELLLRLIWYLVTTIFIIIQTLVHFVHFYFHFLGWNMIRLDGAADLCNSLKVNTTLTYLDLSFNALGSIGGKNCVCVCIFILL